jgi:wobble nucleotide-excising tRNase
MKEIIEIEKSFGAAGGAKLQTQSAGMSISAFERIKEMGVFSDFSWPSGLCHFKAFNLIYGWNGSGKTTISRLLRYLEDNKFMPEDWQPEFKVKIGAGHVENTNPDLLSGSLCVFNVDFVEENIKWGEGRTKKLLIGKPTLELSDKLSAARSELGKNKEESAKETPLMKKAESARDNFLQKRASEIKNRLTTPNAQDKYRNYNKNSLHDAFLSLEGKDTSAYALEETAEQAFNAEIQQRALPELPSVLVPQEIDNALLIEAKEILKKSPVSSFIETLKKDGDLNAWVKKGYDIHTERKEAVCQFCLQSLPHTRMEDLEKHFSDEYKNFIAEINRLGIAIKESQEKYAGITLARSAEFFEEFQEEYKAPQDTFYNTRGQWQEGIDKILGVLRKKHENPFDTIEADFAEILPQLEAEILSHLSSVNSLIEKHNLKAKNLNEYIAKAKQAIENSTVATMLEEYRKLENDITTQKEKVETLGKTIATLTKIVEDIEAKVIQPKIGESNVNKDLSRFLGRDDIKLQYEEDGYSITRNGKKAKNLSEGEKTAIALIYFFSKIREGKPIEEKIIVIDDPISSLDSQSTHFALSYVKDNTISAKQVFLLTHNFYCLKEVKRWKRGREKDFSLYMLDCCTPSGKNHREATLGKIDPLLDKYDSEYHFLFSKLYWWHSEKPDATLEYMYPLMTAARKVLETFLAFKVPQPHTVEAQLRQFDKLTDDNRNHLLRFLDVSSHAAAPERITEFPPASVEEMGKIIDSLFALIQEDKSHFNGMKAIMDGQKESLQAKASKAA